MKRATRGRLLRHLVALAALAVGPRAAAGGPPSGTLLGPGTATLARGFLPEEILARYRAGEFAHEVMDARPDTQWTDPAFLAAAEKNRGHYAVSDAGSIVDRTTGTQPTAIFGPPFPDIRPDDPQAGAKLVWNYFYNSYLLGDDRNVTALSWIGRHGLDRQIRTEVWQKFYDGQPFDGTASPNPRNFLFQQFVETQYPADLQGSLSLTWRYRGVSRDTTWAYVPAIRRIRAISPTNRSDGFLGSDMSQDDGAFFDGKPEEFRWTYVGEAEMLCLYDRAAIIEGAHDIRPLPGGGWRAVFPPRPRFGWQEPRAGVVAWAPLPERTILVRRPVSVVEGVPRDPYYLYGKIVLRLEKDTYAGCYNSKSDWKGEALNTYTPLRGAWFRVGESSWRPYTAAQFTLSQNFKLDRATASHPYADGPEVPSDSLIPLNPQLLEYEALVRRGR